MIKADQLGMAKETVSGGGKNIKISTNLSVDYVNFCYSLEVSSERPIIKLVLRGCITLLESPDRIIFEGFDKVESFFIVVTHKSLYSPNIIKESFDC